MKILHTSDWHIGRQLDGVALIDDQRHVLEQIVAIVAARAIDVVVIAGDIYDRAVPSPDAVTLLDQVLHALNGECGVPVILIAGNHDGPERLGFGARQLAQAGVHVCGPLLPQPQPVLLDDAHGSVAFYPLPYADPATVRQVLGADVQGHEQAMSALTAQIRAHNPEGRRSVVIAHCFLEGFESSDSERPLAVGGVETVPAACFAGFDYVALGHLHAPQARGAKHIRYSGSILKYSFSEARQHKSVTVVEMDAKGRCAIERVELKARRDLRVIEGELEALLVNGRSDPQAEDYLLVRLLDTHAMLDVLGKLRTVYSNVLHIERPTLNEGGERRAPERDRLKQGEMPMFRDFWQQMTNEKLDDGAAAVVAELLGQIHTGADA